MTNLELEASRNKVKGDGSGRSTGAEALKAEPSQRTAANKIGQCHRLKHLHSRYENHVASFETCLLAFMPALRAQDRVNYSIVFSHVVRSPTNLWFYATPCTPLEPEPSRVPGGSARIPAPAHHPPRPPPHSTSASPYCATETSPLMDA